MPVTQIATKINKLILKNAIYHIIHPTVDIKTYLKGTTRLTAHIPAFAAANGKFTVQFA